MAECRYLECRYAECHYTECLYVECRYAEFKIASLLPNGIFYVCKILITLARGQYNKNFTSVIYYCRKVSLFTLKTPYESMDVVTTAVCFYYGHKLQL